MCLGVALLLGSCRPVGQAQAAQGHQPVPCLEATWAVIEPPPQAVVPASSGVVDLVCSLLPAARVAALPSQTLRYSGLRDDASPHLARPTFSVYESERILVHEPDLVLADTWQSADTTERLRESGLCVLVMSEAVNWPAIREQIVQLARVLGVRAEGEALVSAYDQRVEALQDQLGEAPRLGAICYSNGGAGGWLAGAGTTNDEALRLAGLTNLAAETGRRGHVPVSFEELLVMDPYLIVVGGEVGDQQQSGTARLLLENEALSGLQAVRAGRVLVIDSWLYTTTSHHIIDAAEEIARLAQPYRDLAR
ncbi:MAG: hypothetical protein DRQ55_02485 [Planctomycetota bacterium]|nr:MAG: hypothetical protein DRQ55_02485 [Planctomycetota bacterium]